LGVPYGGSHDARHGLVADAWPVTARAVRLTVEVRIEDDEISGHAGAGGGHPRPFHGWLGLIAALDDLLAAPPAEPGRHV
jgi:hypothetical protein